MKDAWQPLQELTYMYAYAWARMTCIKIPNQLRNLSNTQTSKLVRCSARNLSPYSAYRHTFLCQCQCTALQLS